MVVFKGFLRCFFTSLSWFESLAQLCRFESNQSAQRAKQQLDGADIYAGCCTLKIEYARVSRMNERERDLY